MTGQQRPRGVGTLLSGYRASTPRDLSISVPSPRSILERSDVLQALIDVIALVFIVLFLCATAISFPAALCILLFF